MHGNRSILYADVYNDGIIIIIYAWIHVLTYQFILRKWLNWHGFMLWNEDQINFNNSKKKNLFEIICRTSTLNTWSIII